MLVYTAGKKRVHPNKTPWKQKQYFLHLFVISQIDQATAQLQAWAPSVDCCLSELVVKSPAWINWIHTFNDVQPSMAALCRAAQRCCPLLSPTGGDLGMNTSEPWVNIPPVSIAVSSHHLGREGITNPFLLLWNPGRSWPQNTAVQVCKWCALHQWTLSVF